MLTALIAGKVVGADPETREGKNGKPYTTCRVAAMQEDGERALCSVIAFGSAAEALARLRKGDDLTVAGRASVQGWADKTSGEPKAGLRVVAEHVLSAYQLTGRRKPQPEGQP